MLHSDYAKIVFPNPLLTTSKFRFVTFVFDSPKHLNEGLCSVAQGSNPRKTLNPRP